VLIDIEGIDGSGKTTISTRIEARLRQFGHPVVHAGELGTVGHSSERAIGREGLRLSERSELLMLAAREAQRVETLIRPALERGAWVITDRYLYSLLATARQAWGLDDASLPQALEFAVGGLLPDVVVLLDVEPAIARARRRCRGIANGESAPTGRFAQAGSGLLDRVDRELKAFARADPARWIVFDNTWTSLEEAEEKLLELLLARIGHPGAACGPTAPAARPRLPLTRPDDEAAVRKALLATCDELSRHEPPVAAHLLCGLSGRDADERRLKLAFAVPAVIASGLTGLAGEGPWTLRHALKALEPRHVALSLRGLDDDESDRLRVELLGQVPAEVAASLEGLASPRAFELREELRERAPSQVAASLAGDDGERAWELREELEAAASPESLAASLTGLGSERAWKVRDRLIDQVPLAVLASLRGVGGEQAQRVREKHLRWAPRAVLDSLLGVDEEAAWRVREMHGERMREALESARGLDCDRAWELRSRLGSVWPGACASSLEGLVSAPRARELLFDLLARFPANLELLRTAAFVLDPARRPAPGGPEIQQAG
jgi:dTMP kinase